MLVFMLNEGLQCALENLAERKKL